jgi:hypothetical protein
MAVSPTYPGVYVQEVPSGVRTIVGVSTSTTLFIGRTKSGPMDEPTRITTYTDFVRAFGEDNNISDMARYVKLFFLNGGTDAYIMRIANGDQAASVELRNEASAPAAVLRLVAKNPGSMGDSIRAAVTYAGEYPEATFNIEIFRWETDSAGNKVKVAREEWKNLTMDPLLPTYAPTFLSQRSALVNAVDLDPGFALQDNGFSASGRPVTDDNTNVASFVTAWQAILGTGANARHRFRISADGNPFAEVELRDPVNPANPLDVNTLSGATVTARRDALAAAVLNRINAGLTAAGITLANPLVVEIVDGPTAVGATDRTRLLKITSGSDGDVRIASSSFVADDLAVPLMLGTANGGLEVGAHAARRPAASGLSLKTADTTLVHLRTFSGLLQEEIENITLTELDANGNPVAVTIPLPLATSGSATARMWNDASGVSPVTSYKGVLEKLGLIRDAINNYQAANPSKFYWRAELWGYRLAIISTLSNENYLIPTTTFATGAVAPGPAGVNLVSPTNRFTMNVRFYSLGLNATAGHQGNGVPGDDGVAPTMADYDAAYTIVDSKVDIFNLLVLPPEHSPGATPLEDLWPAASAFCLKRRAFLLMDPPDDWDTTQKASTGVDALRVGLVKDYSAIYFPRLQIVENGINRTVGPAGAMAGLYARIDTARGVWKAPAGTEADIRAVSGVDLKMSDAENGQINPVGVNSVRLFPDGVVSWGARTMAGSDLFASEYKYVPIRRLALYIEESLYRGLKWVVFEPNDVPLWAQIRLNVGAFMQDLFRKGAFQGTKPSEAYFVKCDAETTTQNDRNLGIVNIWVGFAPLKPAEFVILYLQQMAGQLAV